MIYFSILSLFQLYHRQNDGFIPPHCEFLAADAKADEADEAHVSDMPGKADVVGVENEIVRSLFKRSPKTSWGI